MRNSVSLFGWIARWFWGNDIYYMKLERKAAIKALDISPNYFWESDTDTCAIVDTHDRILDVIYLTIVDKGIENLVVDGCHVTFESGDTKVDAYTSQAYKNLLVSGSISRSDNTLVYAWNRGVPDPVVLLKFHNLMEAARLELVDTVFSKLKSLA